MATDGVKIIDGDIAHDIYSSIIDLYDDGATAEIIRSQFPFPHLDVFDDFEYEIYTTAYALAMWEIGYLENDMVAEVEKVIDKGACVKVWNEEYDVKHGKQRERELNKLWHKITSENKKVRKRKKYRAITDFLFNINDVVVFQLANSKYYARVLLYIDQYRGRCTYKFGKLYFESEHIPSLEEIEQSELIGRRFSSFSDLNVKDILAQGNEEIEKQGGIDAILKLAEQSYSDYSIGVTVTAIDHRELKKFIDKLTLIGNLNLKDSCLQWYSLRGAITFEHFTQEFNDMDGDMKAFHEETFKIFDLLKVEIKK